MTTYLLDRKTHDDYSFGEGEGEARGPLSMRHGDNTYYQVNGEADNIDGTQMANEEGEPTINEPMKVIID